MRNPKIGDKVRVSEPYPGEHAITEIKLPGWIVINPGENWFRTFETTDVPGIYVEIGHGHIRAATATLLLED